MRSARRLIVAALILLTLFVAWCAIWQIWKPRDIETAVSRMPTAPAFDRFESAKDIVRHFGTEAVWRHLGMRSEQSLSDNERLVILAAFQKDEQRFYTRVVEISKERALRFEGNIARTMLEGTRGAGMPSTRISRRS